MNKITNYMVSGESTKDASQESQLYPQKDKL